jgi:hypothetical protein
MRKIFGALCALGLLMLSCTGNKGQRTDIQADSLAVAADSIDTVAVDTLEQLIIDTPMPKAADELFDDFLFNFAANKRLQRERVVFPLNVRKKNKDEQIAKERWKMEHFFMRQGYYTLMFNDDQQMRLMKDTSVNRAIVERIQLRKNEVTDYVFRRIRGAWMLLEIRKTTIEDNVNASFLEFYRHFVTDSAFQVKSLNRTVDFVGPDPDDDFGMMEGVITADTWEAFAPKLPSKTIYNIVYGDPQEEGDEKIFIMRGIANGLELELRFKKVGERWLLMKMMT